MARHACTGMLNSRSAHPPSHRPGAPQGPHSHNLWSAWGSPTASLAHYHLCKVQPPISSIAAPPRWEAVSWGCHGDSWQQLSSAHTLSLLLGSQMSELLSIEHIGNRSHLIYLANYFQTMRLQKTFIEDNRLLVTRTHLASSQPRALTLPRKCWPPTVPAQIWKSHHYFIATNSYSMLKWFWMHNQPNNLIMNKEWLFPTCRKPQRHYSL